MDPTNPYVDGSGQARSHLMSLEAFHTVIWSMSALCIVAFATRLYIRVHCFRRLLSDDWVMLFALILLLSTAALGQAVLKDVYKIIALQNGLLVPDATFLDVLLRGVRGFGAALTTSLVGILAVKISFLLFFKRLGTQITSYLVFWYILLFVTVACGVTNVALVNFKCNFGSVETITRACTGHSVVQHEIAFQIISVVLDVFSDVLLICFPIAVLWKVRISLRKKILLSCTFALVAVTIVVTIVRGGVFGGTYKDSNPNKSERLNVAWMWFWVFIEFAVAFLVACIISFRALFAQQEKRSYEHQVHVQQMNWQDHKIPSPDARSGKYSSVFRWLRSYHATLIQSLKDLETGHDMSLPEPESGRFSTTFLTVVNIDDSTV